MKPAKTVFKQAILRLALQSLVICLSFVNTFAQLSDSSGVQSSTAIKYLMKNGIPVLGSDYKIAALQTGVSTSDSNYSPDIPIKPLPSGINTISYRTSSENFIVHQDGQIWYYLSNDTLQPVLVEYGSTVDDLRNRCRITNLLSGEVLLEKLMVCYADTTGQATTKFYGQQQIPSRYTGSNQYFLEHQNGVNIATLNLNNALNYQQITDYADSDNVWDGNAINGPGYALDAHYACTGFLNYLQQKFGRNGLDGNGGKVVNYINYGTGFVNAFWNGNAVVYGSGNGTFQPMTTLDIGGHELAHGLMQHLTGLAYSGEPGTIQEAVADMLGTAFEFYENPSAADWTIGEDCSNIIRSMEAPKLYNQPDTYHGLNWYYGTGDNGGVHINSGFLNKWFYLLSIGGNGINDNGTNYAVQGVNIEKATSIVYKTLQDYVTINTGYMDFMQYTMLTAQNIFGTCSQELQSVVSAWKAVGLYEDPVLSISYAPHTKFCKGQQVTLKATGAPYSAYIWKRNGVTFQSGTGLMGLTVTQNGIYSVSENRCGSIHHAATDTFVFRDLPTINFDDVAACDGTPINMNASPFGGTYSVSNPYNGPSTAVNYYYTDTTGCSAMKTASIIRMAAPEIVLPFDTLVAYKDAISIELSGQPVGGEWNFGGTVVETFDPYTSGPGNYSLAYQVTNSAGCKAVKSMHVTVSNECTPFSGIRVVKNKELNTETFQITPSLPGYVYDWQVANSANYSVSGKPGELIVYPTNQSVTVNVDVTNICAATVRFTAQSAGLEAPLLIKIFPAVSNDHITISCNQCTALGVIDICDLEGRLIRTIDGRKTAVLEINIHDLAAGSYFVRLKNNPATVNRFIKTGNY